jgi:acyl-CoA thioesterase-2
MTTTIPILESNSRNVELVDLVDLEMVGPRHFRAFNHHSNHIRFAFGGSILAQALRAAEKCNDDRAPHSLTANFFSAAVTNEPIDYHVTTLQRGRSFSTERVTAEQRGKSIADALVSLQVSDDGFAHQTNWQTAPHYDEVATLESFVEAHRHDLSLQEQEILKGFGSAIEARIIEPESFFLKAGSPRGKLWLRPVSITGRPPPTGYAALVFLSDFLMPAACNRPHIRSTFDSTLIALSLNHAIWFHAPARFGDWFLYEVDSPWAGSGRGLSFGRLYSSDGQLLATSAQEQVLRVRRPI